MKNVTVFVPAKAKTIGGNKTVKVGTGEYKEGYFGPEEVMKSEQKWEQSGWSDREMDGFQLQEDIQIALNDLNNDGFEVISVSPVTSGNYKCERGTPSNGGSYGYGFSYTEGMLIIAKKA
ncbi:MAG: hypothetical protein QNK26_09805 [Moritella sp.]|uniref:hypothetical protein n=1 Tax=Moritella sp. TaxID=78556 RepID=UPI0029BCCB76|nr:hypothetical protein [Moritella sp.]MDX2320872.1 hypothetical protein [Moritella sp.]